MKPHFCSTRIERVLLFTTRANIGRSPTSEQPQRLGSEPIAPVLRAQAVAHLGLPAPRELSDVSDHVLIDDDGAHAPLRVAVGEDAPPSSGERSRSLWNCGKFELMRAELRHILLDHLAQSDSTRHTGDYRWEPRGSAAASPDRVRSIDPDLELHSGYQIDAPLLVNSRQIGLLAPQLECKLRAGGPCSGGACARADTVGIRV